MSALARKLQLKEDHRIRILNSPFSEKQILGSLEYGEAAGKAGTAGNKDSVMLFIKSSSDLNKDLYRAFAALGTEGLLWIAYPKKSLGIKTDISRDHGWEPLLDAVAVRSARSPSTIPRPYDGNLRKISSGYQIQASGATSRHPSFYLPVF